MNLRLTGGRRAAWGTVCQGENGTHFDELKQHSGLQNTETKTEVTPRSGPLFGKRQGLFKVTINKSLMKDRTFWKSVQHCDTTPISIRPSEIQTYIFKTLARQN